MKNSKAVLIGSGIVSELAGIVLLAKSAASDSSPAMGITLFALGVVMMAIGIATKPAARSLRKF